MSRTLAFLATLSALSTACSSSSGTSSSSGASTGGASSGGSTGLASTGGASSAAATSGGSSDSASSGSGSTGGSSGATSGATGGGTSSSSGGTTGGVTCPLSLTNPLYIDGFAGVDSPCCGATQALACHTVTQAMSNIVAGITTATFFNITRMEAFMSNGAPDWTGPETWPVVLHYGVTLHAPGIFFANTGPTPSDLFHTVRDAAAGNDNNATTLEGDLGNPVAVGFNSSYDTSGTTAAIAVLQTSRLNLQDATLGGPTGLALGAPPPTPDQGSVNFGPDPVHIGDISHGLLGTHGIVCDGVNGNTPSILTDEGATAPTLFVEGQVTDITIDTHCTIDMSAGLVLGQAPTAGVCPAKIDQTGLDVRGNGIVQADGAVIQCQAGDAVFAEVGDDAGSPFVDLNAATLVHNGCAAFHMLSGQGSLSTTEGPTSVMSNNYGLKVEGGSFFGAIGATIACNAGTEPGNCATSTGVDVWQQSPQPLQVNQVTWASLPPSQFTCAGAFSSCSWGGTAPAEADIVVIGDAGVVSTGSPSALDGGCP